MNTKNSTLLLLMIAVVLVSSQDIRIRDNKTNYYDTTEGNSYRHVHTCKAYLEKINKTSEVQHFTVPIVNQRFDSDQYIHIGLGLINLQLENAFDSTKPNNYLQVVKAELNAARTLFTLGMRFYPIQQVISTSVNYTIVGYHILLIGQKYDPYGGLATAYTTISKFERIDDTGKAGQGISLFRFDGLNGKSSPFDFVAKKTDKSCGCKQVEQNNNNNKFNLNLYGCHEDNDPVKPRRFQMMAFINGFNQTIKTDKARQLLSIIVGINPAPAPSTFSTINTPTGIQNFAKQPYTLEKIYRQNQADTQFGLNILWQTSTGPSQTVLQKLQLTLLFIGYPLRKVIQNQPANYQTLSTIGVAIIDSNGFQQFIDLVETNQDTANNIILLDQYKYVPEPTKFGHVFCGINELLKKAEFKFDLLDRVSTAATPNDKAKSQLQTKDQKYATGQTALYSCFVVTRKQICKQEIQTFTTLNKAKPAPILSTSASTYKAAFQTTGAISAQKIGITYVYDISNFAQQPTIKTATTINLQFKVTPATRNVVLFIQLKLLDAAKSTSLLSPPADKISYQVTIAGTQYGIKFMDQSSQIIRIPYTYEKVSETVPISVVITTDNIPVEGSITKDTNIQAQIALYTYGKVQTDSGSGCESSCPIKAGLSAGIDLSQQPPICIYCDISQGFVYSGTMNDGKGGCSCKPGTCLYQNSTSDTETCKATEDPLCLICIAAVANLQPQYPYPTCQLCAPNSDLVYDSNKRYKICTCNKGYYLNGSSCAACPVGCLQCSSSTACTVCAPSANSNGIATRLGPNDGCACIVGYFSVPNTPVCQKCDPTCFTCNAAGSCSSCDRLKNFVQNGTRCQCIEGHYLLGNQCGKCSYSCKSCSFSSIFCSDCGQNRQLVTSSQDQRFKICTCKPGYKQIDFTCVDTSCTMIDPYCQKCMLDATKVQIRTCLSCTTNRQLINGKCVCKAGFYQNNGECVQCSSGCSQCTSPTACTVCAIGSINLFNGSCSCQPGFYLYAFTDNLYCKPCSRNCASCQLDEKVCLSCRPGFQLSGRDCVCASGTFLANVGDAHCAKCAANCARCKQANQCDKCQDSYVFDNTLKQCVLTCLDGTYNGGSSCLQCPKGCSSCTHNWLCLTCSPGYNMFAGSCLTTCRDGYFALNGVCNPCSSDCKTCSNFNTCLSCKQPNILLVNTCVKDCPSNTFYGDGSCRVCDSSCLTCQAYSSFCTSCLPNKFLFNNVCYDSCPGALVDGVCTKDCPAGRVLVGNSCVQCNDKCAQCTGSPNFCTSCKTGVSNNGNCIDSCPRGKYSSGNSCLDCDISCASCTGSSTTCNECAPNFIRSRQNCVKQCLSGQYWDMQSRSCKQCGNECKQCVSPTFCTSCNDPRKSPANGNCVANCPSGSILEGDTCVCRLGLLHQSICVTSCPTGFYATPVRTCLACSPPCFTCSGTGNACSSCIEGYTLKGNTCIQTGKCEFGQVLNDNGICVRLCTNGFQFKSGCAFQCPSGFRDNNFGGCIQVPQQTFCASPLFRNGNACGPNCPVGTFPNVDTRQCEVCMPNCQTCLSKVFCTNCAQGYVTNADQTGCIPSSQCGPSQFQHRNSCVTQCPIGTYPVGRLCVRSCKENTFLYNQFCYSDCPTPFYQDDNCFDRCPEGVRCQRTRFN